MENATGRLVCLLLMCTVRNDKLASLQTSPGCLNRSVVEALRRGREDAKVVWGCLLTVADGHGRCCEILTENQLFILGNLA